MAVQASREIVVDAPPEAVMEVLADVVALSSWSPVHKRLEVLDRYADGRPHHAKATIRIFGIVDKEIVEYHWGPDWVVWDAEPTFQQRGQHVEYTLAREGVDKTRVRCDITVEPRGPIPDFIVKRASKIVLDAATAGLRQRVMESRVRTSRRSRVVGEHAQPADRLVEGVVAFGEGEPHQVIPHRRMLAGWIAERRHRDRRHPDPLR